VAFVLLIIELFRTGCDFNILLITVAVSYMFLRMIRFCMMKEQTTALCNEISESFADIESKVFKEAAEKMARKLLYFPTLLFILQIIFVIGNFAFTNNGRFSH
jgi:hypothetical protein